MSAYDVVVVGAGVVGLACAQALAQQKRSVLIVERHPGFGYETSSRNSQVVHSGIYYEPGSNKARLCARGRRSLVAWCSTRKVPLEPIGKYIVAISRDEEDTLESLAARGGINGAGPFERIGAAQLATVEPEIRASAGLWSPETGIVDSHALMASLLADARSHDADAAFRHTVAAVEPRAGRYELTVIQPDGSRSVVTARAVVNAAGLAADEIAALAGIDVDTARYRQTFVKGSYFRMARRWNGRIRHLVYPIPPRDLAGLGVHVTVELDGSLRLGPDVEPVTRAFDYAVDESRRGRFFTAASRFIPALMEDDLLPDQAGVRPKLMRPGRLPDFAIEEESARGLPRWINLLGIESPGLTCCLEIAAEVVERLV